MEKHIKFWFIIFTLLFCFLVFKIINYEKLQHVQKQTVNSQNEPIDEADKMEQKLIENSSLPENIIFENIDSMTITNIDNFREDTKEYEKYKKHEKFVYRTIDKENTINFLKEAELLSSYRKEDFGYYKGYIVLKNSDKNEEKFIRIYFNEFLSSFYLPQYSLYYEIKNWNSIQLYKILDLEDKEIINLPLRKPEYENNILKLNITEDVDIEITNDSKGNRLGKEELYKILNYFYENSTKILMYKNNTEYLEFIFDNKIYLKWNYKNNFIEDICEWRNENLTFKINKKVYINSDMPEFIFSIQGKDIKSNAREFYLIDKIIVVNTKKKNSHWGNWAQVLVPANVSISSENQLSLNLGSFVPNYSKIENWFYIEDMNFDGYKDIRIVMYIGNKSTSYICWIWDIEKQCYIEDFELEEIPGIEVDYENNLIYGWSSNSPSGFNEYTYKYIDGKLTLIYQHTLESILRDENGNDGVEYEFEYIDGKLKMTKESFFQWKG